jgi:hypothetical protein
MSAGLRYLALLSVACGLAAPACAGEKKQAKPETGRVARDAHRAAIELVQELERLQEDVVQFLLPPQEPKTYREVEILLRDASRLENAIKPGADPEALLKKHAEFERRLVAVMKTIRAIGPEQRAIQRSADHVQSANEELFYSLVAGDGGAKEPGQAIHRQAAALAQAARNLEQTAKVSLTADLTKKVLYDDIKKLAQQSERFAKGIGADTDRAAAAKDFQGVDAAYAQVVQHMALLQAGDNLFLVRSAGRFDRLHGRLHRLLGIQGKRPQLIVGS